jgi:tetratricopeptide (TPR) repeat protein
MQNYQSPVLLNGMGGMGKSKLMNYWVRAVHDRKINNIFFQHIIYVNCSVDVETGFLNNYSLLDQLGLNHLSKDNTLNKLDIIIAALNQLDELLLVLDDLPWQEGFLDNCADQLARFSTLPCRMIATSRSQDYDDFKQIHINSLSEKQCIDLFLTYSKTSTVQTNEHIQIAQEIVELAGNHTLTIELLGKTAHRQQYSPDDLLNILKANRFHIDTKVRYKKDSNSINESIDSALGKLFTLSGLSKQQQEILYHLSLMDSQEITLDLLIEWLGENLIKTKSVLVDLLTSGWLQVGSSNNQCYQLHQVVSHAVLTEFCNTYSGETRIKFLQPVVAHLEKYYRQFDTYQTIQEATLDQKQRLDKAFLPAVAAYICNSVYLTHDFNHLEELTDSLNLFTEFCLQQGEYNLSWKVLTTTIDHLNFFLGEKSSSYSITINNLATLNFHLGNFEKALNLYKRAIHIAENNVSENNLSYAGYLANLASLYQAMGEYKLALPLYHKISSILSNETSEKSIEFFAASLNNLALLYKSMGKYQESLQVNLKASTVLREKMNGYYPGYATSLNNLADLCEKMGNYKEALPLYKEALKIRKDQLGDLHPDYASSLNSLADLFESMENYEESLILYTQALEIRKKTLGENHYDYATSLNNLAFIHHQTKNYQQALPLYLQSLEIREKSLGKKHPEVAASLNNLADVYKEKGNFKKSLLFNQKALDIRKEKLGIYHPLYAESLSNMACLYSEMGKFKKSIPFYLQAMVVTEKALGYEHPFSKGIRNSYLAAKRLYEQK